MPEPGGEGTQEPPRTLAEKLTRLREALAPEGGKPPSWDKLAKRITAETGTSITGQYLWNLAAGKAEGSLKLRHLKAFAAFFGRTITYFAEDTVAFEDDIRAQTALLEELRRLGVDQIRLQNMDHDASPEIVTDLLGRLKEIDVLSDPQVRAMAMQLADLAPEQREALGSVAGEPTLLSTLPRAIGLLEAAAGATDEQIASAAHALTQALDLQVLQDEEAVGIARQCRDLLPSSRQAVLSMIRQLDHLEKGQV
ncbi:hypothetical protein [Streptomyces sp. 4F14]|uniref:hypothetical protein n=1 Tax=Streptomyces sp. 4F14 TaxID=3394380 RepID=UPI003A8B829E